MHVQGLTWMTSNIEPRMVSTALVRVFRVGSPSFSMNLSMGSGVMKTCIEQSLPPSDLNYRRHRCRCHSLHPVKLILLFSTWYAE